MDNHKIKVTFLFGAGAEGKGNYGICNGFDYIRQVLVDENKKYTKDLKKYFSGNYFEKTYKYREDASFAYQKIFKNFLIYKSYSDIEFYETHKDTIRAFLGYDINIINEELNMERETKNNIEIENHKFKDETDFPSLSAQIDDEFKKILRGYDENHNEIKKGSITNDIIKKMFFDENSQENDKPSVDFNLALSGILDSYFHTIISPAKYSKQNFSKVINFYWKCYFLILFYVLKYFNSPCFEKCFQNATELNYEYVLKNLEKITDALYCESLKIPNHNTYYDFISQKLKENKSTISCHSVITTNYFRFCETIIENPDDVIYLNGQLKYFEFPETLDVIDVSKEKILQDQLFFPFIFGQSLVKPIVSVKQTEEFHKLNEVLFGKNSVDVLVILGYNINEDDNHINSYLHKFVNKENKRVIVVTNKKSNAHLKLKCDENKVEYCEVEYLDAQSEHTDEEYARNNSQIVDAIFDKIQNPNS